MYIRVLTAKRRRTIIGSEAKLTITRAFKSGNSQAVRIPAELAYTDMNVELSIRRVGETLILEPVAVERARIWDRLVNGPKPSEIEVYEPIELPDREGL